MSWVIWELSWPLSPHHHQQHPKLCSNWDGDQDKGWEKICRASCSQWHQINKLPDKQMAEAVLVIFSSGHFSKAGPNSYNLEIWWSSLGWAVAINSREIAGDHALVQDQLQAGHIVPSNSPWNTPTFIMKKKSGKWILLQDLSAVNEMIQPMGPPQQGLPFPSVIPWGWHIIIVDLKDCFFFTIPPAKQDSPRFAFSLPSVNFKESA